MPLTIIAAMSENRVIGRAGDLPWRLPADLRRFKALTLGHHVIMGRKTFDSLGRALPERVNIVITRKSDYSAPDGVLIASTLQQAIEFAGADDTPFILGGGEIYALALEHTQRMELTIVHTTGEGDTFFPEFDESEWKIVQDEHHEADDKHEFAYSFRTYERTEN